MASINLLPEKKFELTTNEGAVIPGQFGTWALKRFCDKKKLTLREVGERFQDPSIDDAIEYILCSIECTARETDKPMPMNDITLCKYIDQLGGMQSADFSRLFNHSGDETTEEKKTTENKEQETLVGTS